MLKNSKQNVVWLALGAMLMIVFARLGLNINLPVVLLLVVSIIPALLGNPSQFVAMLLTFIPLSTAFQYKYAILLFLIIGIVRFGKLLTYSKIVPIIIVMMIWELAHGLDANFSYNDFFRNFAEILLLGFIVSLKWCNIDYKHISRSFALSVIGVSLIVIYIKINSGFGSFLEMLSESTTGDRFGQETTEEGTAYGLNFNANQLGFICNMAIASLLVLIARKEYKLLDIVMLIVLIFLGAMTLSRTFVVVVAFLFLSFILFTPGTAGQRAKNIFLLLVVSAIFIYGLFVYAPSIIENFNTRNDTNDITNGRAFLMEFYHNHIFSSFEYCFWGIGLQNSGTKIVDLYNQDIEPCHNSIQEIWLVWGVFGVFLFIYMIIEMIKKSRQWSGRRSFYAYIPFCALLFSSMAARILNSSTYMLSLLFVYIVMCLKWNNKNSHVTR